MIRALTSSAISGVSRTILQFLTILYLTTFLNSADYGLYAFTLPFTILTTILFDAGFGPLVVRPKTIEPSMISSLHRLAIIVGLCSCMVLFAGSFAAERFVADPRFPGALRLMAVVPFLGLTGAVPRAVLERYLDYGMIAKIEIGALSVASAVSIGAALLGAGIWSLFALSIIQALLRCALFNAAAKVSFRGRNIHLAQIYADGKWITLQNLQVYCNRNLDNILVGAYLGSSALGAYALAYQIILVPLQAVAWPFGAVLLSILRRLHRPEEQINALNGTMLLTLSVIVPTVSLAAAIVPEVTALFLSRSWRSLPFLVQALSVSCIAQVLGSFCGTILISQNQLRLNFYIGLVNTIILSAIFLISTIFFDIEVMVSIYAVYSIVFGIALLWLGYQKLGERSLKFATALAPPMVVGAAIALSALVLNAALADASATSRLVAKFAAFLSIASVGFLFQWTDLWALFASFKGEASVSYR